MLLTVILKVHINLRHNGDELLKDPNYFFCEEPVAYLPLLYTFSSCDADIQIIHDCFCAPLGSKCRPPMPNVRGSSLKEMLAPPPCSCFTFCKNITWTKAVYFFKHC